MSSMVHLHRERVLSDVEKASNARGTTRETPYCPSRLRKNSINAQYATISLRGVWVPE